MKKNVLFPTSVIMICATKDSNKNWMLSNKAYNLYWTTELRWFGCCHRKKFDAKWNWSRIFIFSSSSKNCFFLFEQTGYLSFWSFGFIFIWLRPLFSNVKRLFCSGFWIFGFAIIVFDHNFSGLRSFLRMCVCQRDREKTI